MFGPSPKAMAGKLRPFHLRSSSYGGQAACQPFYPSKLPECSRKLTFVSNGWCPSFDKLLSTSSRQAGQAVVNKHRFYRTRSFNLDSGSRPCRVRNDRLFPRVSGSPCPRVSISLRYPDTFRRTRLAPTRPPVPPPGTLCLPLRQVQGLRFLLSFSSRTLTHPSSSSSPRL